MASEKFSRLPFEFLILIYFKLPYVQYIVRHNINILFEFNHSHTTDKMPKCL